MTSSYEPEPATPGVRHALAVMYVIVAVYGAWNVAVGAVSVTVAFGALWGLIFPILLTVTALCCLGAMYRTEKLRKPNTEIAATIGYIACMISILVAVCIRNIFLNTENQLPGGLLPLVIAVPAYFRLVQIAPPIRKLHRK